MKSIQSVVPSATIAGGFPALRFIESFTINMSSSVAVFLQNFPP